MCVVEFLPYKLSVWSVGLIQTRFILTRCTYEVIAVRSKVTGYYVSFPVTGHAWIKFTKSMVSFDKFITFLGANNAKYIHVNIMCISLYTTTKEF